MSLLTSAATVRGWLTLPPILFHAPKLAPGPKTRPAQWRWPNDTFTHLSLCQELFASPKAPEGWRSPRRSAFAERTVPRDSVLECGGPPPLFPAPNTRPKNLSSQMARGKLKFRNIEHRTSSGLDVGCWLLVVGCFPFITPSPTCPSPKIPRRR